MKWSITRDKIRVIGQCKKGLWPDPVLSDRRNENRKVFVDTKWKVPGDHIPGDDDLRQMFAYNLLFGCRESILLYPGALEGCPAGTGRRTGAGAMCYRLMCWMRRPFDAGGVRPFR